MSSYCSSPILASTLEIVRNIMELISIIVPIVLIVGVSLGIFKLMRNPDEKNGVKQVINKVVAAVIIFMIPVLMDAVMLLLGSNTTISDCWNNSRNVSESKSYTDITDGDRKKLSPSSDYEKGEPSGRGVGAGAANSVSDKTDYSDGALNVVKVVDTNVNNPSSGRGDGRNMYRAAQAGCYTGRHVVYGQNKNLGSIDASSYGGRICWSLLETGEQVKCVEVGAEGGHMDGVAYDNDRGYVLKTSTSNGLMLFDNVTMEFVGYSAIDETHVGITYVPSLHMLVGYSGGSLVYYQYNSATNKYEKKQTVPLENYTGEAVQGLGTDGTNIFIADSSPYTNYRYLYTYSLSGRKLETHSFGSGFGSLSDEVEAAFADNNGILYLVCPQGIGKVTNYVANKIGLRS